MRPNGSPFKILLPTLPMRSELNGGPKKKKKRKKLFPEKKEEEKWAPLPIHLKPKTHSPKFYNFNGDRWQNNRTFTNDSQQQKRS